MVRRTPESVLAVTITTPMTGEWETLLDEVDATLDPEPLAIYVPSAIEGGTPTDAEMLRLFWSALGAHGIPILPPR